MAASLGYGATLGIGVESTYGTKVSRTNWLEVYRFDVKQDVNRQPINTLGRVGDTSRMRSDNYVGGISVPWSMSTRMAYDDSCLLLLEHCMGAVATTGAGPYVHTFTLGAIPDGLSLEFIHGTDGASAGDAEVCEGGIITEWSISATNGQPVEFSVSGIGETTGGFETASSVTYTSNGNAALFSQGGSFSFNTVSYAVNSFALRCNNGLSENRTLADVNTAKPVGDTYRTVTGTVELVLDSTAPYAAYLAGTVSDFAITFTGTGSNALTITGHNAYIKSVSKPVSSAGRITQSIEFECQTDGTDLGLAVAVTNSNALHSAN